MHRSEQNIQTVQRILDGLVTGDLDGALAQFDPEAKWYCPDGLPEAGVHDGREGIGALFGRVRERFAGGLHLVHLTLHASGENVYAEFTRSRGKHANGPGSEHQLAVFELVYGKVREVREFTMRWLDLKEAPPPPPA